MVFPNLSLFPLSAVPSVMTPAYQTIRGGSLFLGHATNVCGQSAGSLERTGYLAIIENSFVMRR
jgi:hypothetical protein